MRLKIRIAKAASGLILAAGLAVTGCSPIYSNHGYVPREEDLKKIEVGRSTTEDVTLIAGRPTAIGVLAGSSWYYVGSRFRQMGIRAPKEIDRQVVAVSFDEKGTVKNVERFGLKDGRVIALSRRVTESNVKGLGFLRQLLGNLGNPSAAQLLKPNT
ncbi:MAG: outer membrane protein assembly factor BamE [Paracoccaceae bacterium]